MKTLKIDGKDLIHPLEVSSSDWTDDMKYWPKTQDPQIVFYLIKTKACDLKDMEAFRQLESYNYLNSGWVGKLYSFQVETNLSYVKGKVTPSQSIHDQEHLAWVCVRNSGEILNGHCSCMAGTAKSCSHVGAILWKISMANNMGLAGSSCTDEENKWNKGTKKNLEPLPLENVSFRQPKKNSLDFEPVNPGTSSVLKTKQFFSRDSFYNAINESKLSIFMDSKNTLLHHVLNSKNTIEEQQPVQNPVLPHSANHVNCPPCQKFYDKFLNLSRVARDKLLSVTHEQSNDQTGVWDASRKLRITASGASGVPKRKETNPDTYLNRKLYKKFYGNAATKHGTMVSKEEPWLSASPDGLIGTNEIVEIKCPATTDLKLALERADVVREEKHFSVCG